jgi:hypothetical protein
MRKQFLTSVIFWVSGIAFCQNTNLFIIDYDNVLNDLKNKGKNSIYYRELDYNAMLLLDYNCVRDLLRVNPNFMEENSLKIEDYKHQIKSDYIKQYQLLFTINIKELFSDQKNIYLILQNTTENKRTNYELDSKVYIKEPNTAVFTITGGFWTKTIRLTLKNGLATLEPIEETIE